MFFLKGLYCQEMIEFFERAFYFLKTRMNVNEREWTNEWQNNEKWGKKILKVIKEREQMKCVGLIMQVLLY